MWIVLHNRWLFAGKCCFNRVVYFETNLNTFLTVWAGFPSLPSSYTARCWNFPVFDHSHTGVYVYCICAYSPLKGSHIIYNKLTALVRFVDLQKLLYIHAG
jgi:hypothetical protein